MVALKIVDLLSSLRRKNGTSPIAIVVNITLSAIGSMTLPVLLTVPRPLAISPSIPSLATFIQAAAKYSCLESSVFELRRPLTIIKLLMTLARLIRLARFFSNHGYLAGSSCLYLSTIGETSFLKNALEADVAISAGSKLFELNSISLSQSRIADIVAFYRYHNKVL